MLIAKLSPYFWLESLLEFCGFLLFNRKGVFRWGTKKPDLVFPVVLLTESEDPVAESEHVLEGTVPWIREFLDFQQGPLPTSSSTRG